MAIVDGFDFSVSSCPEHFAVRDFVFCELTFLDFTFCLVCVFSLDVTA